MSRVSVQFILVGGLVLALSACGDSGDLSFAERVGLANADSPDEFAVLPQKPLELPEDLSTLPEPTPGAANRTDLTPEADMLVALSGRPVRGTATGSDQALVRALTSGGVSPTIRADLAAEDEVYRENNRGLLLERVFRKDTEHLVYERQRLDAEAELLRLRALGIRVPPLPGE